MTNKINGDFGQDSLEAFRAAYAAQLVSPEDHEVDPIVGIPTEIVHNTSPWLAHTGLWKANDGMSRDFKPNLPFNMEDYLDSVSESSDAEDESDTEGDQDEGTQEDGDEVFLTDEEFDLLTKEIWGEDSKESAEEGEMTDEEVDAMIDEILGEGEEDEGEGEGEDDGEGSESDDEEDDDDEEDKDDEDESEDE